MLNKKNTITHGFTLIEVMVAISIFAIVVTVGMSALLTATRASEKATQEKSAVESLTFMIESMSRKIRTGYDYQVSQGGFAFSFFDVTLLDSNNAPTQVTYRYEPNDFAIYRQDGTNPEVQVSDPTINITDVNFFVPSTGHPYVMMIISGTPAHTQNQQDEFTIQTSVSQRLLVSPTP